ncbi:MAG: acetate/propionate family kinase [Acidobacteriota bacterium]|nr:acetate/propionate family kinase [Acidobacteriota bacterium]
MNILVLNAGSSSLKISLFDPNERSSAIWETHADIDPGDLHLDALLETRTNKFDAVGHRIVHGGSVFRKSTLITPGARQAIKGLRELAPAHNAIELQGIEAIDRILGPAIPQIAVFDTAFHATLPPEAYVYPGPYEWLDQDIRRYGFHGISHQYTSRRAAEILGRDSKSLRLITCHLGNGCSLAAIRDGVSIDTTMGFTPLEGLMMGSRSGSIDPAILLYLLNNRGHDAAQLARVLNQESGLKGISGVSEDMREVLKAKEEGNPRAQLAFDMYVHSVRSHIGGMLGSLGGLDALIFTAGVGENCAPLRAAVCEGLGFLNLKLDLEKNEQSPPDQNIALPDSMRPVLIVHTRENWEIALECIRVLNATAN